MSTKSMDALQKQVDDYIGQFKEGYFEPLAQLARMTEELGELAREINHHYGEKQKKNTEKPRSLEEETGDLFFVLICLANSLDINLGDALDEVMAKFNTRDQDRWTKLDKEGEQNG
ncbi:MAG TPA: nucleotide pyrophosphohydrolase [Bacillales bacterium]